jgi:hypothetical protein
MKYSAKRDGHVGRSIPIERDGHSMHQAHILAGDVFEWEGPQGKWMQPIDEHAEDAPTKAELMEKLNALGIKFFKGATVQTLTGLLPKVNQ